MKWRNHNALKVEMCDLYVNFKTAGYLVNADSTKSSMRQDIRGGTKQTKLLIR